MHSFDVDDLDPAATLGAVGSTVRARRAGDVRDLELAAHWADLHSTDPRDDPQPDAGVDVPEWAGGDQLVEVGGDGTPLVRELCLPELGIARECHTQAAHALVADALDLRHRLPRTWAVTRSLACEVWVARKVASLTRGLDRHRVALVDAAVAAAIGTQSPGRVLTITGAKIIEADPEAHAARLEAERRRRSVTLTRSDEHGLRYVIARIEAGDAVWVDATISRVADILRTRPDLTPDLPSDASRDELRAVAFGWLARPAELLALLLESAVPAEPAEPDHDQPVAPSRAVALPERALELLQSTDLTQLRPRTTLYVHLHQAAVDGTAAGVARVEGLTPVLLTQLGELLGHTQVVVRPVIDLTARTSVNSYEHPEAVKERTWLRTAGDTFPHATGTTRRLDFDHPAPYRPDGPPGQTGDHNAAPLNRRGHRAKTHLGYRHRQVDLTTHLWTTPHGQHRLVDERGTRVIDDDTVRVLTMVDPHPGAVDQAHARALEAVNAGFEPWHRGHGTTLAGDQLR